MLKKSILYLYAFFVIYMPPFSSIYFNISIDAFSMVLLFIVAPIWVVKRISVDSSLKVSKALFMLFVGLILAGFYATLRAYMTGNNLRFLQNFYIIPQLIHILILRDLMFSVYSTGEQRIGVLINLAVLQAGFAIIMFFVPSFKNVALLLYYNGREENIFISQMRIFGISNDYTFFTPIYHSVIASIALLYAVFKDKKYWKKLPFILLIILVNGRYGLILIGSMIVFILIKLTLTSKNPRKLIVFTVIIATFSFVSINFIKVVSPPTYNWLKIGMNEISELLVYDNKIGNIAVLTDKSSKIPTGISLYIGEGYRLFGGAGEMNGFPHTDIGYYNDLFIGGIIYILILYGTIFRFLVHRDKNEIRNSYNTYISLFLCLTLLLSNYKGEVMRSGLVLYSAILIKLVMKEKSITHGKGT